MTVLRQRMFNSCQYLATLLVVTDSSPSDWSHAVHSRCAFVFMNRLLVPILAADEWREALDIFVAQVRSTAMGGCAARGSGRGCARGSGRDSII